MKNWQDTQRTEQWQLSLDSLTNLSYQSRDLTSYLQEVTTGVSRLLQSDWSGVTIQQGDSGRVIASSPAADAEEDTRFSPHSSVSEVVVKSGKPFLVEDVEQHPEEASRMSGFTGYLGVPLRTMSGAVIGTVCSFSSQPRQYDAETIATVELFAARAATAIDNYHLYQRQQQFNTLLEAEVEKRTAELRAAQATLIERERLAAIGELASMIVHEIRNPLTTVQMGLDYFNRLDLPESAQARLSLATDEAKRLARLLREISSYSKPQVLRPTKIDVDDFIRSLLVSLRSIPAAEGRSIEYLPYGSPISIVGDTDKLKQVFINLVRNACEAVEPGETVRWSVTKGPDECICVSVHNGGRPIPPNVLPQLTQPFFSTKSEGTGLGLAIVKRIVDAHSGQLLIESSRREGTTFSVHLPLKLS